MDKIKRSSLKQLIFIAVIITFLSGIRSSTWNASPLGPAGTGIGFPFLYWKTVTSTDVYPSQVQSDGKTVILSQKPYISEGNMQLALILSGIAFLGDIIFWSIILLLIRKLTLFRIKKG